MKCVNWLIEEFHRDNSFLEIKEEALKQNHNVEVVESIPFFYDPHWKLFPKGSCTVFLGSISCARQMQREWSKHEWNPAVWCSWENYRCVSYYAHWGEYIFNKDYRFIPVLELKRNLSSFFKNDGTENDYIFLRPDSGAKPFTAALFRQEDLANERTWKFLMDELEPEALLVVSSPKKISREWRVVCSADKVITGSRYKTFDVVDYRRELPEDVEAFANSILLNTSWRPDPVFVMDICSSFGKLYLLEIGAFNVAGLYHCDFEKIVKEVSEIALKTFEEDTKDIKDIKDTKEIL